MSCYFFYESQSIEKSDMLIFGGHDICTWDQCVLRTSFQSENYSSISCNGRSTLPFDRQDDMVGLTACLRACKAFIRHFCLDGRARLVQASKVELRDVCIGVVLVAGRNVFVVHPFKRQCRARVAVRIDCGRGIKDNTLFGLNRQGVWFGTIRSVQVNLGRMHGCTVV